MLLKHCFTGIGAREEANNFCIQKNKELLDIFTNSVEVLSLNSSCKLLLQDVEASLSSFDDEVAILVTKIGIYITTIDACPRFESYKYRTPTGSGDLDTKDGMNCLYSYVARSALRSFIFSKYSLSNFNAEGDWKNTTIQFSILANAIYSMVPQYCVQVSKYVVDYSDLNTFFSPKMLCDDFLNTFHYIYTDYNEPSKYYRENKEKAMCSKTEYVITYGITGSWCGIDCTAHTYNLFLFVPPKFIKTRSQNEQFVSWI